MLALWAGASSESLSLQKDHMLGSLTTDFASLCQTALGVVGSGCLSPNFPWCDGPSVAGEFFEVVQPGGWFVNSHWSLLPTMQAEIEHLFIYLFFFIHLFIVHTLFGPFLTLAPALSLSLPPPSLPDRTCSTLFSSFVEEQT
jgi:hypothetical protein